VPHTLAIIRPDQNYKDKISSLLHQYPEQKFIIKPVIGGGGHGVVLARKHENEISVQSSSETVTLDRFNLLKTSLIQEALSRTRECLCFHHILLILYGSLQCIPWQIW